MCEYKYVDAASTKYTLFLLSIYNPSIIFPAVGTQNNQCANIVTTVIPAIATSVFIPISIRTIIITIVPITSHRANGPILAS